MFPRLLFDVFTTKPLNLLTNNFSLIACVFVDTNVALTLNSAPIKFDSLSFFALCLCCTDGLPQKYLAYWKYNNLYNGNNVLGCKRCGGATWIGMFKANTHTSINKLRMRNAYTHMLLRGLNYITNWIVYIINFDMGNFSIPFFIALPLFIVLLPRPRLSLLSFVFHFGFDFIFCFRAVPFGYYTQIEIDLDDGTPQFR